MIQLKEITLREIQLPLVEPFQISSGVSTVRRIFILELADQDGTRGWSECVAGGLPNYSSETIDTAWLAISQWLAPRVLHKPIDHPRAAFAVLDRDIRGHNMAKAAVEMGIWEVAARQQEMSLAELLGGTRSEIATGISLGIQDSPEILARKAADCLAQGYRKIKMKIKPGRDIDYLSAVRAALGPDAPLMADANNAYTLDDRETLLELDAFGLMMIEQPLAWDDVVNHAELQRVMKTPICLDESITDLSKAENMVALGSGRIVNIKPGRVGGFSQAIAIHDYCQAHDIPVWCGGMLESGVGRAHNVALASLPNFVLPGDLSPSARYWQRDIVEPEWTMNPQGLVAVPRNRPGMGVTVNRELLEELTVRSEILSPQA